MLSSLRFFVTSFILLSLIACSQGESLSALQKRLEEIKRKPQGTVELTPSFKTYEGFTYGAGLLRSPFIQPVAVDSKHVITNGKHVQPDRNRVKESLEAFDIEELTMVGTVQKDARQLYALITDKEGNVYRVKAGNYLGKQDGKVTRVTDTKIDLVEVVPDGGGWVERPRSLVLKSE